VTRPLSRRVRACVWASVSIGALFVAPACSSPDSDGRTSDSVDVDIFALATSPPSEPLTRVILVGDSLAQEIASNLTFLLSTMTVVPKFYGGTAPCDWTSVDLEVTPATIAVITFTGNSQTPCMTDGAGGYLRSDALVARYRDDLASLIETVRAGGGEILLVGQPARGQDPVGAAEVDGLNQVYATLAELPSVGFVDAGAAVENDDGSFAQQLPCAPIEPECGDDGTNRVRSDDGVHFCPGLHDQPCPEYSSGSLRFALAIAGAVQRFDREHT
jgi:hypothetical protein